MTKKAKRPDIDEIAAGDELKTWYWLKEELVAFARNRRIPYSGSKQEITERIAGFIDTGTIAEPKTGVRSRAPGEPDWHSMEINRDTVITANYRNSQNVRRFFKAEIGPHFTFNIAFMAWIKASAGKSMGDAADEWQRLDALRKAGVKSSIPSSNQFNAYVRAFFVDNPKRSMDDARHFWKLKRSLPGHNRYEQSDLDLKP